MALLHSGRGDWGETSPYLWTRVLLHHVLLQPLTALCRETPLAACSLADCPQNTEWQEGAPLPAGDISPCFLAQLNHAGFISSLPLLCLTRSVISLAPLCPPDLTADRAQPCIFHHLPALSFDLTEQAASPSLDTRSPHAPCRRLALHRALSVHQHCSWHLPNLIFTRGAACCRSPCFRSMALFILQEPVQRVGCVSSSCNSARGMKMHFKRAGIDINMHTYVYTYIRRLDRQDSLVTGTLGLWG